MAFSSLFLILVSLAKSFYSLEFEPDFNRDLLDTLLSKTTDYCRADILIHLESAQNNSNCDFFAKYFIEIKEVKKCNNTGDIERLNALNNLLLAESSKSECAKFSSFTLNNFFKKCWISQLDGLHYIPPIVTDLTPVDAGRFDSRFSKFSNKSVRNVCCLVERAATCFEHIQSEHFWKSIIEFVYLKKPSELLKCEQLKSEVDICESDGCCSLQFFPFLFLIFLAFV